MSTPDVGKQATDFAQRMETLLQNVLGGLEEGYVAEPHDKRLRGGRIGYRITQREKRGIELNSDGETVASLSFSFECSCKDAGAWLQVDKSVIMVSAEPEHMPLFHYDFNRVVGSEIPGAHINIFGSNDAATRIMLSCGNGSRGKSRRKKYINDGAFPTFSTLHFPVGGDRFRPGLEDVLQMAVYEFHIDTTADWKRFIEESRAEYRERQLKALIREFPDIAYDTLKREGYLDASVPPERPHRDEGQSRLTQY
ncbi:hypothetical protein BLI708_00185 [Bifidobacterium imperatoris]|uniref:Uncharacterized protein n=1 Tax=Bifidobacterium imperatoris TaxID=2020965 RepID=A0A2N5IPB7_9BIFI|nr:hypothetical protein [Bifidobacterium imperatoris]PLS23802.1 hypothetical protein Tam1G_2143 [Bifidobacterium imperatoris]QSY57762.1 hypothetical protein BLI708_11340 [Bifidobacterium imperatoris]QSY57804.1 hypothetical protein BLI708_00185 [Bifidobacterium imperatoris]